MADNTIAQIVALAEKNQDIEIVWLYGSRARNTHTPNSDYDLAVAFKEFIKDPLDCPLRPELLALDWQQSLGKALSIVDINKAPIPLSFVVISDNMPIYTNENKMRIWQEESRIMSMWELDYSYSRKTYG